MIVEIKKPITKAKLAKAHRTIQNKKKKKGFNPDQFLGKVKWEGDGVSIQRLMRDEWL
ncbi:MAG TPA: hypothetical protein PLJ60_03510 [Chryseolinea sp.]|nr:hypothetical protein [Chryseolinea sp.]HPH46720.1 hypothetical protein [Chryseolinea sp.]HPM29381.1 hypothetical protein [Chryseolinea sp.]